MCGIGKTRGIENRSMVRREEEEEGRVRVTPNKLVVALWVGSIPEISR